MKKLKKIIYVSIVGASFVVLMVRNKNLPIRERIQVSVKGSLKVVGMSLAIRFGIWSIEYNERGFVNDGFRENESSIVCANSSTQSLTRQKSELSSSYSSDELDALGFGND